MHPPPPAPAFRFRVLHPPLKFAEPLPVDFLSFLHTLLPLLTTFSPSAKHSCMDKR